MVARRLGRFHPRKAAKQQAWQEVGLAGPDDWWEAAAVLSSGRKMLVLQHVLGSGSDAHRCLQVGREMSLQVAGHERRGETLHLANGALEGRARRGERKLDAAEGSLAREVVGRRQIDAQNLLLAQGVDGSAEMILVTDLQDRVTFVNRSFVTTYGYSEDEVVGRHVSLLHAPGNPPDLVPEMFEATRHGGWTGEIVHRRKDGAEFPVSLITSGVRGESGNVIAFIGVARDISERQQADEALRRSEDRFRGAQKMEAVGQLAGGVAHDFNNLLTVMSSYAEMALARVNPSDPIYLEVAQIQRAAMRAADLTTRLLAFSRRQTLAPRILDLNVVTRAIGALLRPLIGDDIKLIIRTAPTPATVMADQGQIEQVIMNLAVNARDAMPLGGPLTIEVSTADLTQRQARLRFDMPGGHLVMLTISDTGHGMDTETQARIFEPFFTTKPEGRGTGLGLPAVYGIVTQSGGTITVASRPGEGTSFTICLPEVSGTPEALQAPAPRTPLLRGSEVVLVVEDDEGVRELLTTLMRRSGYEVFAACGGEEALEMESALKRPLDLVLTDMVMPGMSGRELAGRMAELRPGIRVLLLSGYTDEEIFSYCADEEGAAFLLKPFTPDTLLRKVRDVLDAR